MPGSRCHCGEAGDTRDIKSGESPAVLALGAGRSPAARAAMEPLSSGQHLVPAQGTEGMGRHRETHTDTDGQRDGMLCLPSQGQRYGTPRWVPWQGPPWRARQRWAAVPLDSTHPLGIPGSPLPCTHTHPSKSTPYTGYFPRMQEGKVGRDSPAWHSQFGVQPAPTIPRLIP